MAVLFTIVGFLAGTLTTVAFMPQVLHTFRSKSVKDLSYAMLISFSVGVVLWVIYGIYLNSWPMIIANGVTFVFQVPLIFMKVRYSRHQPLPSRNS
ncbi:MAG TPA: SemiSWEET transporter [Clostridia bacterium]|nr:SemiSWEET transporter [Clostridia bacterium]